MDIVGMVHIKHFDKDDFDMFAAGHTDIFSCIGHDSNMYLVFHGSQSGEISEYVKIVTRAFPAAICICCYPALVERKHGLRIYEPIKGLNVQCGFNFIGNLLIVAKDTK